MFVACWSAKGGSGATVTAAALALVLARSSPGGAVLVDLAGDLPAVLGMGEPAGPGLTGWFGAGAEVPSDALVRLQVPAADGLTLLPRGPGGFDQPGRAPALVDGLTALGCSVVIDAGTLDPAVDPGLGGPTNEVRRRVVEAAPQRLVVSRACYLSLRRLVAAPLDPTGIVLVAEPGRALGRRDVEEVVGVEVVAEVPVDAGVARAVDAGLLAGRLPAVLARALGRAA